ncbi:DUF6249 domain-containing protein [Rhodohalobacter mucosus]|uniref:Phenylalanyl-tRNA synthetase subunit alpha chain n=1 Tax=Rhodohalobacter mucosus TaxID=2079485 RepID=A0A316TVC8_9BACT|nr:DUF6249 domain-containing protein [Rhodohalobacter mucosus]PWN07868.1 phenylalanyl-tRNA synthetase subunit alpha chain [Rhodohalobacter mucosus]
MSQLTFTIIFLAFLTAGFLAWFFTHQAREKERLMLIEKGIDVPDKESGFNFKFRFPWLRLGIVITAISTGIFTGILIESIVDLRGEIIPVFMFLFGGIGMIIAHYAGKKDS